jgi:4-hydroxy-3-polyprenylbenzoate decarboxylase
MLTWLGRLSPIWSNRSVYAKPNTLEDLIDHTVGRVLDLFDIDVGIVRRWSEDADLRRRPDSRKDPA